MGQKRYGGALALVSVLIAIVLFSIWPPQRANSAVEIYIKRIDSMNYMNRLEIDLYQYKKRNYEKDVFGSRSDTTDDTYR